MPRRQEGTSARSRQSWPVCHRGQLGTGGEGSSKFRTFLPGPAQNVVHRFQVRRMVERWVLDRLKMGVTLKKALNQRPSRRDTHTSVCPSVTDEPLLLVQVLGVASGIQIP